MSGRSTVPARRSGPSARRIRSLSSVALAISGLAVVVITASPASAAADTILKLRSRGPDVALWQQQLNAVRDDDLAVDGVYGPATRGATQQFQAAAEIAADGIVGPLTRATMSAHGTTAEAAPARQLQRGDRGRQVRVLQERLAALNYWVGPIDGAFGMLTRQAVVAFQKINGLPRDGMVDAATRRALQSPRTASVKSDRSALVLEVDKSRQVLIAVRNGVVQNIWNTSTGTGERYTYAGRSYLADTPSGEWSITRQIDGWRESNLGQLYRPKYFHRDGIAIHGYPRVPAVKASHGCVRVSMAAMDYLWTRIPVGTPVLVY